VLERAARGALASLSWNALWRTPVEFGSSMAIELGAIDAAVQYGQLLAQREGFKSKARAVGSERADKFQQMPDEVRPGRSRAALSGLFDGVRGWNPLEFGAMVDGC